jgi:glucose/arabinose dehydrogenase
VRFAADGRIFVAQKNGQIYSFDASGGSKTLFADLSTSVLSYWDRGLLGLALAPNFPSDPAVYVLYTYDAPVGGTAPKWNDGCPTPPGPTTDGCLASARLSKLTPSGTPGAPTETVLVTGWCQQFPAIRSAPCCSEPTEYLYAGAGDGASFDNVDYGQYGSFYAGDKANRAVIPLTGRHALSSRTEGGALRSQSVRRTDGPTTLNGGDPPASTPPREPASRPTPGAPAPVRTSGVLAYGLRNPFRFTARPGTNELWIGDVGSGTWEEIDRVADTTSGTATNFGWPCYEARSHRASSGQRHDVQLAV